MNVWGDCNGVAIVQKMAGVQGSTDTDSDDDEDPGLDYKRQSREYELVSAVGDRV